MKNSYSKQSTKKEITMRIATVVKGSTLIAILGLACLLPARVYAQVDAQPDPDLYEGPNTEAIAAHAMPTAHAQEEKADFAGRFSLPYNVECDGRNLRPGQYSISVRSQGTNRVLNIHSRAANMNIPVRVVPANQGASRSAVLVRASGEGRKLEAVYVEGLNATLYLEANTSYGVMERLPIS